MHHAPVFYLSENVGMMVIRMLMMQMRWRRRQLQLCVFVNAWVTESVYLSVCLSVSWISHVTAAAAADADARGLRCSKCLTCLTWNDWLVAVCCRPVDSFSVGPGRLSEIRRLCTWTVLRRRWPCCWTHWPWRPPVFHSLLSHWRRCADVASLPYLFRYSMSRPPPVIENSWKNSVCVSVSFTAHMF